MYNDDKDSQYENEQGLSISGDPGSETGSKSVLLQRGGPGFRDRKFARWQISSLYPDRLRRIVKGNVIIVDYWRRLMNEQMELNKLAPAWRLALLRAHGVVCKVAKFVWTPVTWITGS